MASVTIVLRKRQNKSGRRPLIIQVIKDRKTSIISLGYSIYESDWDEDKKRVKKSHPNHVRLNNLIKNKVAEVDNVAIEIETQKKVVSSKAITKKAKSPAGSTFFVKADEYLIALKTAGNYNVYTSNKPGINHFRMFLKEEDIAFSDITVSLLQRFKVYLKAERNISDRTILNYLSVIRSVYKFAFDDEEERRKYSPFGEGKISIAFPPSLKVGLEVEDVIKLEQVVLDNPNYDHARDLWLISFYFAGMRISDVLRLRWSDFQNGRLNYQMGKNKKIHSFKVHEQAELILKKHEQNRINENDFVFKDLADVDVSDTFNFKRRISEVTSRYDKFLDKHVKRIAGITGKLTMHISRHTFATIAGSNIPVQRLQELYGHSDIRTTIAYQNAFIHKDTDEALGAVLDARHTEPIPADIDAPFIYGGTAYLKFTDEEFDFLTRAMHHHDDTKIETEVGGFWYGNEMRRSAGIRNGQNPELNFRIKEIDLVMKSLEIPSPSLDEEYRSRLFLKLGDILEQMR